MKLGLGNSSYKKLAKTLATVMMIGSLGWGVRVAEAETVNINLDHALELALANNRTIKQALTDVDVARWTLAESRRRMGPTLTWDSSANRIGGEAYLSAKATGMDYDHNYVNTGTIAMPLYNATLNGNRAAARYGLNTADLTLESTKQSVRLQATTYYYNILQARNLVNVQQETVNTLIEHMNVVNAKFNAGVVARADVLATEVQLANANQSLTTARNNYDIAVAKLNNLIGLPTETELEIADRLSFDRYDLDLNKCTAYALENRADGLAAIYAVKQAEANLRTAKGGYQPTINALATRSVAGDNAFEDNHPSGNQWAAGISASWNIFDNGVTSAQVNAAKAKLIKAEENKAALDEQIRLEVHTAYLTLTAAEQNINTTETAVSKAEEDYNIARVRYRAGIGTNLDVMTASENLTTAMTNYYTALYNYNAGKASLDQAMGVPIDLDAKRYYEAEQEGMRARKARAEAALNDEAVFETPKNSAVRETVGTMAD